MKSSSKLSLSIVIITFNEERNIVPCLQSLKFSEKVFKKKEVIVVDSFSQDKTVSLARRKGAKVFQRAWKGFSDQKSWALGRCKGDWTLWLDADEELTPELIREIERAIPLTPPDVNGYLIKRKNIFLGKWIKHCGWWPDTQLRLIKPKAGWFTKAAVHEGLEVNGRTLEFDEPMTHYSNDSIFQYLEKMNRYSSLAILKVKPKKIRFWWFYVTVFPWLVFFRMFITRRGFLDGWPGFVVCGLSAFHDFCKYAKLWEKEILRRGPGYDPRK
jgi:glycosyltransferase involved in cell wall biosynthesis